MSSTLVAGKVEIQGFIELLTGMHIGTLPEFAPIGPVDQVIARDALTKLPVIPGSSLKGKLRHLLGKLGKGEAEHESIQRLFGSAFRHDSNGAHSYQESRLQFYDLKLVNPEFLEGKTDLLYSEIKFENTINRKTAEAFPRQIERVPAGACFDFKVMYTVPYDEDTVQMEQAILEDFKKFTAALKLLKTDYLGGHGSRGYGRLDFKELHCHFRLVIEDRLDTGKVNYLQEEINTMLSGVHSYEMLSI